MRKYFGTDGVRGKVNEFPLTAEFALKLGMAAASVLGSGDKIKVIIGKDTRLSGYIYEYALTSGLCSMGADVYLLGPMPTPAIAYLVKSFQADIGIMITASHNPATDNGIKFFDKEGYKLPDEIEERIEQQAINNNFVLAGYDETGKAHKMVEVVGRYVTYVKKAIANQSLSGLKVVVDNANGAAYRVTPLAIEELGAKVVGIGDSPDGTNINKDCGAMVPEKASEKVLETGADVGISLDGDADRVIMIDENGEIVDGDEIIAICALDMHKKKALNKDTVVVTVMSNLGFEKAMKENQIKVVRTKVGDRYVIDEMRKHDYSLGGEQSGHIIFLEYSTAGCGTISALQVLAIMKQTGKKLSELKKCMTKYPQKLQNVIVKNKPDIEKTNAYSAIKKCEKDLGDKGRILVRYSGTENKCRVMIEAESQELIDRHMPCVVEAIKKEMGQAKK